MRALVRLTFLTLLCAGLAPAQKPSVTIERIAAKRWRATYRLTAPTISLRFDRPAGFFRERVWTVATPGYRFARAGDMQIALLDSGATPKSEIVFEFPEFTDNLPKEYELFQPFTDGAVAIYTGHFHAIGVSGAPRDTSRVRMMRFPAVPGAHAIVNGKVEKGAVSFRDDDSNGTYVYLGSATPIETPDVVAVVDPGMPPWLKTMFDRNIPALFHEYAARFGATLPSKPVVLFSFDDKGSGLSSGGGSLTGLLNMVLSGSAWRTETPAAGEQAFHLIAHESAHLWNGQVAHNNDGDAGGWMHEGSADAVSNEMLLYFKVIDSARYRVRREEALNRCVGAVATGSVTTALKRGSVRTVYDCGAVMAIWTEAAARKSNPGSSMFTFWRQLIVAAGKKGRAYDQDVYFNVARASGVPDSVVTRMRTFLATQDSTASFIDALRQSGLAVRPGQNAPPASYQQDAARTAMVHLMRQACDGHVNLTWGSPVRSGAVPTCAPFANPLEIFRIQTLRVSDEGAAIHDAVRAACASGASVVLQTNDGTALATVPCTKPLAARPTWFEIGG